MPIQLHCPGCKKGLKAPDSLAGKVVRCPNCKQAIRIPAAKTPDDLIAEMLAEEPAGGPASRGSATAGRPAATAPSMAPAARTPAALPPLIPPALPPPVPPAVPTLPPHRPLASSRPVGRLPRSLDDSTPRGTRLYWVFALTLIPLALSLLWEHDDFGARLKRTVDDHPEAAAGLVIDNDTTEDKIILHILTHLPDGRIEGAHLSHGTWLHWFYGLVAAGLFLGVIRLLFPQGNADVKQVALVGLCTATFGILFLLSVQWIAQLTSGWIMTGGNIFVLIIFYIIKFIGFSYQAAADPDNGFLLSFLGFTFGVGLCEELAKMLPVVFHFRSGGTLDWRGACMWGLASGIGFGIAEGIMYSSDSYNGLATVEAYVVRFVSCVGLHATWSASVAIMVWRRKEWFEKDWDWGDLAVTLLWVLAVPMTLHGLYDTALKKEVYWLALTTAIATFGWLAFLIEWTLSQERRFYATA